VGRPRQGDESRPVFRPSLAEGEVDRSERALSHVAADSSERGSRPRRSHCGMTACATSRDRLLLFVSRPRVAELGSAMCLLGSPISTFPPIDRLFRASLDYRRLLSASSGPRQCVSRMTFPHCSTSLRGLRIQLAGSNATTASPSNPRYFRVREGHQGERPHAV
jgi:hypothetical protein